jgi:hypothetical protein
VDLKSWPSVLDIEDQTRKKAVISFKATSAESVAYIDFSVSTTGNLAGVKVRCSANLL